MQPTFSVTLMMTFLWHLYLGLHNGYMIDTFNFHCHSAFVLEDQMWPFMENKSKFMLSSRIPRGFKEAVEAMEDAVKTQPHTLVSTLLLRKQHLHGLYSFKGFTDLR